MPELPEVEVVRLTLLDKLKGLKVSDVSVLYENIFPNFNKASLLVGSTFKDIKRKGKYLIFVLDNCYLLAHLRMEGKFFYLENYELNKHMHVIFKLSNGYNLIYQDVRKFGRIVYFNNYDDLLNSLNLAFDANSGLECFSIFKNNILSKKGLIKPVLLDQSVIAGLGNIYVDEVLYKAGLMPNSSVLSLSDNDLANILIYSKEILDKAISYKGTTIKSYTSSLGVVGEYQDLLFVHTKKYCPLNHKVLTVKVGGRTTYFCPICQSNKNMVIGLTGGIACGKSVFSRYLKSIGYKVFCADTFVSKLYKDTSFIKNIKNTFNLTSDNFKLELKNLVFNDYNIRCKLENIIHPLVKDACNDFIKNNSGLIFLDIPLLFETKMDSLCNKTISVISEREIQLERILKRDNVDLDLANKIIDAQISNEKRVNRSSYVINNNSSLKDFYKEINYIIADILKE